MNKKHVVGYALTAVACFGAGLGSGGSSAPDTTTPTAVTVTTTAAAPTPASATVTVSPPATTETHTVTQTVEAEAVTEVVERKAVTVTLGPPEPEETIPGSGTFEVGVDVSPGTYVSEASGGCYWARLSGSDGFDSIIDNNFGDGQMIVTIKESDRFFETSGCGPWARRE